jgi:hypothetical protein
MKILDDERAENPLEVGFYVLLVILTMAFMMFAVGAILDTFENEFNNLVASNPLSSWGTDMMATYMSYIDYVYAIPSIFIVIVMIWGVRAVIRKHTYTSAQDPNYQNYDEF